MRTTAFFNLLLALLSLCHWVGGFCIIRSIGKNKPRQSLSEFAHKSQYGGHAVKECSRALSMAPWSGNNHELVEWRLTNIEDTLKTLDEKVAGKLNETTFRVFEEKLDKKIDSFEEKLDKKIDSKFETFDKKLNEKLLLLGCLILVCQNIDTIARTNLVFA
jgi:hypothetical protein